MDHAYLRRQSAIGLGLAFCMVAGWLALHILGVFVLDLRESALARAATPAVILVQCWFDVGLFIIAHDAMHGSLAPFRPKLNRAVGRLCLALYAGFSYDRLLAKHFDHHRFSGTERDPDFSHADPTRLLPWYAEFMRRYVGLREVLTIGGIVVAYLAILRARPENVVLFWAVPAFLSSLQLFYFGTFLPHRHSDDHFPDRHNARSTALSPTLSLLTCLHFGTYHHEHHLSPRTPWWRLPRLGKVGPAHSAGEISYGSERREPSPRRGEVESAKPTG